MSKQTKRLIIPDVLKGFAVLFMIQVHILELFSKQEIYDGFIGKASLFLGGVPAAPVFMLVMGYFLAFKNKDEKQLLFRGIKLFIAGLILNFLLNLNLAFHVFYEGWNEFVNIYHYWFGADILHLAGLSVIVIGLFRYGFKDNLIPWIILALSIPMISSLTEPVDFEKITFKYIFAFLFSNEEWSYFPLIPWLAYPITGYVFRLLEMKFGDILTNKKLKLISGVGILILLIFTFKWAGGIITNLPAYYHHGTWFFFWAIGLSTIWSISLSLFPKEIIQNPVGTYIRWLGKNVTLIYIIQWIIIGNIGTILYKTQTLSQSLIWFSAVLLATSLLTLLIQRKFTFRI